MGAACNASLSDCDVIVETAEDGEEPLAGRWVSSNGKVHLVGVDAVHWQSGEISRLRKRWRFDGRSRITEYATELEGVRFIGRINEAGKLEWDDGDIWVRDLRGPETGGYAALSSAFGQVGESVVDVLSAAPGAVVEAAYFVASPVVDFGSNGAIVQEEPEPKKAANDDQQASAGERLEAPSMDGRPDEEMCDNRSARRVRLPRESPRRRAEANEAALLSRSQSSLSQSSPLSKIGEVTPTASPLGTTLGTVGWSLDVSNPYTPARVPPNGSPLSSRTATSQSLPLAEQSPSSSVPADWN